VRPAALAVLVLLLAGCARAAPIETGSAAAAMPRAASDPQVERGRYLALVADCAPCHVGAHGEPYGGGRAIPTPFGTLRASNLTPDPVTGIGAWTDQEFARAVRDGVGRRREHLYPAMPYPYYTRMPAEDVAAIRAFLATIAPVSHAVEANQLPFPFRIRSLVGVWNRLYFRPGTYVVNAGASAQWNRGAYLVEGPGHCGACHTPKSRLGGDDGTRMLAGAALDGWFSPDLRDGERTGLGTWSAAELADYLRSGTNAHSAASGPMAEVITESTAAMSDPDIDAIVVYLRSRKEAAGPHATPPPPDARTLEAGRSIYADACAPCHGEDARGVLHLFPPLRDNPVVQSDDPVTLIRVVLHGTQNAATDRAPTGPSMPSFGWKLDDGEVAAVLSYVRSSWGNTAAAVTPKSVASSRHSKAP